MTDRSDSPALPVSRRALLHGLGAAGALAVTAASAPAVAGTLAPARLAGLAAAGPPWAKLKRQLTGTLYVKGKAGYAGVAKGFNPRFDSIQPAAVARCASAADVAACLAFARTYSFAFTVRAGGHALGGWSTGTGLVIDTAALDSVVVDTTAGIATVGAGTRLVDLYQKVAAAGVAVPGGTCPSVAIAGLAMGGGFGVLTRQWGLVCDQIQAATVVLADGTVRRVDATHSPDLFWALRGGGGGSFGVVTSFDLRTRALPTLSQFSLAFPFTAGAEVLDGWQRWLQPLDRRMSTDMGWRATRSNGKLTVGISGTWTGPASALGAQVDALVARIGVTPTSRSQATKTYAQTMLDETGCTSYAVCYLPPEGTVTRQPSAGASTMVHGLLSTAGVEEVVDQVRAGVEVPNSTWNGLNVVGFGGAVGDVGTSTSSYAHRDASFMLHYLARWSPSKAGLNPAPFDGYVRGFRAAMKPYAGDAAYVNYQDSSIADYGAAYWPGTYATLRAVKSSVDPGNVFRFPQSVAPA